MGNSQSSTSPGPSSPQSGANAPPLDQNMEQQKNVTHEYEQQSNPLEKAFQKGILKREIIASNNILILSHTQISSTPNSHKPQHNNRPRVSLDLMLLSREGLEKGKKISHKVIDEGEVGSESTSSDEGDSVQETPIEKSRLFKPILLNQENLIKIQQGNIHKKYKMLQKIGEGGFGTVFKAICLSTQEARAVKVITLRDFSPSRKKLILNEISMLLKLDHPNIIKLYEIIEHEANYYIVTEYCEGGSLAEYLLRHRKGKGQEFAKEVMRKLLSAVKYLHSKSIIHRDLKLDNIVIKAVKTEDREELILKVIDFGLAIQSYNPVAKSDMIIGTPQYVAPECTLGMYSLKSDIWGCGIVLYMMLAGESPFRGPSKTKVFDKIKNEEIDLQTVQWKNISFDAKDLLYRMLAKSSAARPTATEALNHCWFVSDSMVKSSKSSREKKEEIVRVLTSYQKKNNLLSFIQTYTCLTKISQDEREKLIRHFNRIDLNRNGVIELSELKAYFSQSQAQLSEQETSNILRKVDLNQNDRIDLNEFICALANLKQHYEGPHLEELFRIFDRNGDGFIEQKELKAILQECHREEISYLFRVIDRNKDGRISLEEFRRYLLRKEKK